MLNDNNTSRGEAAIFAPLPSPPPVTAGREAAHPTGAPFDHRDIHENAIGMIGNECVVHVLRDGADEAGRPWAFVATLDGHPVGWIYRELISYN
ncbi:MAG: peptide-binding protein [Methylocystis sp.]